MKKILIYALLLAAALLVPTRTTELGKLRPVETLAVYQEEGQVVIETDTKDIGRGMSVSEAIINLKETAPGIVFLDTAEYLLIMDGGEPFVQYLSNYLKDSIKVCSASRDVKIGEAATFLTVHKPETLLAEYRKDMPLQLLRMEQDRLILEEK